MTRDADLQHVRRKGKRIRTRHLEVRAIASPLAHPRVGVVVPRHKHSAVDRNLLKRRLREVARLHLLPVLPAVDLVVRASPEAYGATFAELVEQLVRALPKLRGVAGA